MIRPSYPTAGHPAARNPVIPAFRKSALPVLLVCTTALAGCATTTPPPEIAYDDAAPAVQTVDPPAPVTVVELPRPLPLPGQMKPVETTRRTPEPVDDLPDHGDDPWDTELDRMVAHHTLGQLSPVHRSVLTLRYVDDLPVGECAEILGRTVGATEALLTRAKRAFRAAYPETQPQPSGRGGHA